MDSVGRALLEVLDEVAAAIKVALGALRDWGPAGTREGQYRSDLVADEAALRVLDRAGLGVLSEESGRSWPERPITVVVDPVDGSTNAARGIPWFATSLCAVDGTGPIAALVVNLADGTRFEALHGQGARRDGRTIAGSGCRQRGHAVLGLSGYPTRSLGWEQYRVLGAVALDLCAVASGVLDGFVDCSHDAHAPWDYLGALLVCREAGVPVVDAMDRELVVLDQVARRTPVAAATDELLSMLVSGRRSLD